MMMPEQEKKGFAPYERMLFLMGLTFLGGYLNAYANAARGGSFVSFHTGNMMRLGITAADGAWADVPKYLVPICACLLGACFSEWFRLRCKRRDWRQGGLLLECAALFAVGLVPAGVQDGAVCAFLSFLAGFHLCLFRAWEGGVHNTTICTGNLRSVGILLHGALAGKAGGAAKFLRYAILVFSFPLGACIGTLVTRALGARGAWPLAAVALAWFFWFRACAPEAK